MECMNGRSVGWSFGPSSNDSMHEWRTHRHMHNIHACTHTYLRIFVYLSIQKKMHKQFTPPHLTHTYTRLTLAYTPPQPPPTYVVVMPTQLAIPMHAHKEIHPNVLGAWKSIFLLDVLKNKPWPRSTQKRKITSFPKKNSQKLYYFFWRWKEMEEMSFNVIAFSSAMNNS